MVLTADAGERTAEDSQISSHSSISLVHFMSEMSPLKGGFALRVVSAVNVVVGITAIRDG